MAIHTYLMGRCGNQLFQYAAGLGLARRLSTDLLINNSRFVMNVDEYMYSLELFAGIVEPTVIKSPRPVIVQRRLEYDPHHFDGIQGTCTIKGYWQAEQYFTNVAAELRERIRPRAPLFPYHLDILQEIRAAQGRSVFVTVRRGNFVSNPIYRLLPDQYYAEAAEIIASKLADPVFFVFSDDPIWCRDNFRLPHATVIAGNFDKTIKPHLGREDAELELMRNCRHAVMANSSYSWWGAWLGADVSAGIVIAPKFWFQPNFRDNESNDACPERWIKL